MNYHGVLKKMQTELGSPIQYYLVFKDDFLNVNQLLDKNLNIYFEGYQCLNCGKAKKIYRQGFCYDCFYEIPQAADWIMKPELSKAHLNIEDRDLDYEKAVNALTAKDIQDAANKYLTKDYFLAILKPEDK